MDQKLFKLTSYFRNYSFTNDFLQQQNPKNQPTHQTKDTTINLQTCLQQSINNAKTVIDLYQQKIHLLNVQNESLTQDTQQLKLTILQDKKQAQKLLQASRYLVDVLRKQLMEKDQENRTLSQKIDLLEITQADQLCLMKNQQNQDAFIVEKRFSQQKLQFGQLLKRLSEDLEDQKQYNSQLIEKISLLAQQVQALTDENKRLRNCFENFCQQHMNSSVKSTPKDQTLQLNPNPTDFCHTSTQPFIPQLQFTDLQQPYPISNSQDQILNYSYEDHRTALKDVLNFSGCNSSRFNMTRQFLRSKQKENFDDNFIKINSTNSNKNIYMSSQKHKLNQSSDPKQQKNQLTHHNIRQFTMNDHTSVVIDPYFVFFTLTAQCIKINSEYFDEIAQLDIVDHEWSYVIDNRIPMNLWASHLEKTLLQKVGK